MKTLMLALTLLLLPACSLAYIPLIPEAQVWEPVLELRGSGGLAAEDGRLVLRLSLSEVPEPGWLALQWFGPNRLQVSESIWIEQAGEERIVFLPGEVELVPGLWRVVVSFDSAVARQFSLTVD
ncbi:MAG: hypothetical protein M3498_15840 [Deinococcota bacterium]|jgi:hypothetical protein|nr:hypothetical protein [Deinococcota bacterium]